ncbi:MAG TPA: LD-carboxypeptidase [Casimicrobiaceae bacterium]|nr:LD-carboxypeptidase [Casimicrobiaceae bacterium]
MSASLAITIVAPAGFASDPAAVDRAEALLTRLGHCARSDATARTRWQRFSAPDDERLAAIERVAADPQTDVAVMLRGGYGFSRLIDRIDFAALARAGKRWMGHSDFTAFQLAALARSGMVTYAGPMAAYDFGAVAPSAFTLRNCFGLLENDEWSIDCALDGPSHACAGTLWGGNLAMVAHLVGTPYFPQIDGGILFLEDVGEHPYRIERMFHQLLHAGVLARQRAVLLGTFTEYQLHANDAGYDIGMAIAQLRSRTRVPVHAGLPFGHVPDKLTLPVGGRCALTVEAGRARLELSRYR